MMEVRNSRILQIMPFLFTVCLLSFSIQANEIEPAATADSQQNSIYVFLPEQSTVVQTGGIAGVHRTYVIGGQFQLSVDPDVGTAFFAHVDANAVDDSEFRHSLDPNEVFNLSGLVGIIIDDTLIYFAGKAANDTDIFIIAIFNDDLIYLFAQTYPPAGSADFFIFNMDAVAQRKYGGGTREPNDPYLIYTPEQMNTIGLHEEDWDKHFKLMADIDLREYTGTTFNIIGYWNSRSDNKPFTGIFDGNSKKISNFTYTSVDANKIGLFGYVDGENAQIKALGLQNPNVDAGAGRYIGGLVGDANGCITDCYIYGGNISGNHIIGGLIGFNRGIIMNCSSSSIILGTGLVVGGLVGGNSGAITDCHSTGEVSAVGGGIGGLVGSNTSYSYLVRSVPGLFVSISGTITNCYASGNVFGSYDVGGLVGINHNKNAQIMRCYSNGEASGESMVGGLVGTNSGAITNCYASGSASGSEGIGGLVGLNLRTISNCYSTGLVSGDAYAGALIGSSPASVMASFWDIETSGQTDSAGGQGKTTAEMQMASTFLDAGWDFIGEAENGTEDIWWIDEGQDYPILSWELPQKTAPQH